MREKAIFCAKALNVAPLSTTESVLVHVLVEWTRDLATQLTHQISYYSEGVPSTMTRNGQPTIQTLASTASELFPKAREDPTLILLPVEGFE